MLTKNLFDHKMSVKNSMEGNTAIWRLEFTHNKKWSVWFCLLSTVFTLDFVCFKIMYKFERNLNVKELFQIAVGMT